MQSLLGAVCGAWGSRALSWALGFAAFLFATPAAAQITAPALRDGSTFLLARPHELASEVSASALVEVLIDADGGVQEAEIVELAVSAPDADAVAREALIAHPAVSACDAGWARAASANACALAARTERC